MAANRRRPVVAETGIFDAPDVTDPFGAEEGEPARPPQEGLAGSSLDGTVSAEVDARGTLVDLRVRPEMLCGAHPQRLGRAVVEAMADARASASRAARRRLTGRST